MKTRFIPAFVALLAGAAISIINIINKTELVPGLRNLLITIVVFYVIGSIAKFIINRTIEKQELDKDVSEIEGTDFSDEITEDNESDTNGKPDEFVK